MKNNKDLKIITFDELQNPNVERIVQPLPITC